MYAFVGYLTKLLFLLAASPAPDLDSLCTLAEMGWSLAVDLDEYVALTGANCSQLDAGSFLRLPGVDSVVSSTAYPDIVGLAWADVINSAAWIFVVAILELDVQLQERGRLQGSVRRVSQGIKAVLYTTILAAAIYWGFKGAFVDFWDAFLWVIAFVFIELNVLQWRAEDEALAAATPNA